jgi:hypothetical protein
MRFLRAFATLCLLLAAGTAVAQAQEWVGNYRDAYRELIRFEKYGKAKNFIQYQLQLAPRERTGTLDGVRLTLAGKSLALDLPLDAAGRTSLPLQKAAYDENAELTVNGKAAQFATRTRVSIAPRADGTYDAQDLRAACEQALGFLRYRDEAAYRERKCVGVRFAYARAGAEPVVQVRQGGAKTLPVQDGGAYPGDAGAQFRTVTYRFDGWPDKGQVVTQGAPAVIAPLIE